MTIAVTHAATLEGMNRKAICSSEGIDTVMDVIAPSMADTNIPTARAIAAIPAATSKIRFADHAEKYASAETIAAPMPDRRVANAAPIATML